MRYRENWRKDSEGKGAGGGFGDGDEPKLR